VGLGEELKEEFSADEMVAAGKYIDGSANAKLFQRYIWYGLVAQGRQVGRAAKAVAVEPGGCGRITTGAYG